MQELKEMDDEPDVVTDYVSLLRSQVEYKVRHTERGVLPRVPYKQD